MCVCVCIYVYACVQGCVFTCMCVCSCACVYGGVGVGECVTASLRCSIDNPTHNPWTAFAQGVKHQLQRQALKALPEHLRVMAEKPDLSPPPPNRKVSESITPYL